MLKKHHMFPYLVIPDLIRDPDNVLFANLFCGNNPGFPFSRE